MCSHRPGTKFSSSTLLQHPMHSCGCCYAFFPLLLLGEGRNRTDRDRHTDRQTVMLLLASHIRLQAEHLYSASSRELLRGARYGYNTSLVFHLESSNENLK